MQAPVFERIGEGGSFNGFNAKAVNGGNPIPLDGEGHPGFNFASSKSVPSIMAYSDTFRTSIPTEVDLAILADIGYQIAAGF